MKIEKFSEFAQKGQDACKLSDPIYVRGLPWKILARPREMPRPSNNSPPKKNLGYFLQCNAEDQGFSKQIIFKKN
jgi:hypothetical protein